MPDRFTQDATIELPQPADPWRIAEDICELLEILFGENWKKTKLRFTATSTSNIAFYSTDLTSLQQRVTEFGGPMRDISIYANLWLNNEFRSADPMILFAGEKAETVLLSWQTPIRVDTEAMRYGTERVMKDFSRRKRWNGAKFNAKNVRHHSQASPSAKVTGPQLIRVKGVKWGLRRWFVRNRDNIIVGLLASTVASVALLVLQLTGLVPMPT
ncbi:hypothetical protein [Frondihabitans peucedani]|uniref:Uncharacterized protein n=1 Tax=Frondihabitans peucedani TaxID=598626 RepID=A0ABP8E680_9MICO